MSAFRRTTRERGSISIEFVGTIGIVLVMLLIALQGLLAMHALSQANSAARNAARAETLSTGSGQAEGLAALSSSLRAGSSVRCTNRSSDVTCEARVQVPMFAIGWLTELMPPMSVSRSATMPQTEVR
ncbi:TadE/TadG family type IV pilus assembly protein [Sediminivirga luteola]|uniref:TadE-like domain-containing protein n=1 Tax=Sediminivirga luteola TaxID=1774748 RepID=A0A8J2TXU1_9MICO|nr:TadE/TadG family type IV pilus assembly protein [Sediminivirga luteola]MCI2266051.1 pilus assembly protein [Sediminivirga luteola]GGA13450.1 hypothetical protein GCM10011333_15530 [Sediminivirga luteola]